MTIRSRALLLGIARATVSCGSPAPATEVLEVWTVGSEPQVSIGGRDERPDYIAWGVVGAGVLEDGRIFVANQGSSLINFYSPTGEHRYAAGGAGRGPGEFGSMQKVIRLPGDTLLVVSLTPGLTWISPEGAYIRSGSSDVWGLARHPCRMSHGDWWPLADGTTVTRFEDNPGQPGCKEMTFGVHRTSALLERQNWESGGFDTLGVFPGTERNSAAFRVYGGELLVATSEDRIFVADTRDETIVVLASNGDTIAVAPTPFAPVPVSAAARSERSRPPWPTRPGFEPPVPLDPPYDYSEMYPRIGRILPDQEGNLWVMAYPPVETPTNSYRFIITSSAFVEEGGARWRVLGPSGEVVAEVRTPPGLFPLEIGEDYVLGMRKDEYDVEVIELYSLARRP